MTCRVSEAPRRLIRFISWVTLTRFQQLVRSGRWGRSCLACGRPPRTASPSAPVYARAWRDHASSRGHCHTPRSRPGMASSCAKNSNTFARGRCLARLRTAVLIHPRHLKDLPRCPARSGSARKPTWINSPARQSPHVRRIQTHWRVKIRDPGLICRFLSLIEPRLLPPWSLGGDSPPRFGGKDRPVAHVFHVEHPQ